ncbi:MAG: hypothetical protein ACX94B_13085 [Henriciella sp.]
MKLTKNQALFKKVLDDTAAEIGVVGEFQKGHRHDKYKIVLPDEDSTVLMMPVYSTPKTVEGYARTLPMKLRNLLLRHFEKMGMT